MCQCPTPSVYGLPPYGGVADLPNPAPLLLSRVLHNLFHTIEASVGEFASADTSTHLLEIHHERYQQVRRLRRLL